MCKRHCNTAKQFILKRFSSSNNYNEQHTGPLESSNTVFLHWNDVHDALLTTRTTKWAHAFESFHTDNERMADNPVWLRTTYSTTWKWSRAFTQASPLVSTAFFFFVNITNSRVHFSTGCYLAGIMHLESRRSIVQTIHANFRAYSCNITQNVETPLHREPTQECRIHSSFLLNILYGVTTCSLKL